MVLHLRNLVIHMTLCLIAMVSGCVSCSSSTSMRSKMYEARERVAVFELRNLAGLKRGEIHYLSNLLRQAAGLLSSNKFLVMTNDSVEVLLPPETDLASCEGSCPVKIGQIIQAHWLLVGEVVRLGAELRVSLNLYHVKSASLRGSVVVKGRDIRALEGPIQGAAGGLFDTLDPSSTSIGERLNRGVTFPRFNYEMLPELPQSIPESEGRMVSGDTPVGLPARMSSPRFRGVNFGDVNVEELALYDEAVRLDEDPKAQAEEKVDKWEEVARQVKGMAQDASARAQSWRDFIENRDRHIQMTQRHLKARRTRLHKMLKHLRAIQAEHLQFDQARRIQMRRDWIKLSKLISLRVVRDEDKLKWIEAFLDAYGAISQLNPYVNELTSWTHRMKSRLHDLKIESRAELELRERRTRELNERIEQIEQVFDEKLPCYGSATGCPQIKWIRIPAGHFLMGSRHGDSDERPVHRVHVKRFRLSESEVTVSQYRECVIAGVCTEPERGQYCNWGKRGRDAHPVNCVDWGQARTFSRWVGGDLPTEAQWEYAARAGTHAVYSGADRADEVGWYRGNARGDTHEIKTRAPNAYRLYDMSGNLWEWVLDEYRANYSDSSSVGESVMGRVAPCKTRCTHGLRRRVIRGGAWIYREHHLRVSGRSAQGSHLRDHSVGFRPAQLR